jgi:hypothetical protein
VPRAPGAGKPVVEKQSGPARGRRAGIAYWWVVVTAVVVVCVWLVWRT